MERPTVQVIQTQQEITSDAQVSQSEVNYLLAKYGYTQPEIQQPIDPNRNLTFEEMVQQEEAKIRNQKLREQEQRQMRMNQAKAITFDGRVQYTETKYQDLEIDDSKFGIRIEIVSDMKIN